MTPEQRMQQYRDALGRLAAGDAKVSIPGRPDDDDMLLCAALDELEQLRKQSGIPWQRFDPEKPPEMDTNYLIKSAQGICYGVFSDRDSRGISVYDGIGNWYGWQELWVTHFASINLPEGEGL